jgi:hypothetical protein
MLDEKILLYNFDKWFNDCGEAAALLARVVGQRCSGQIDFTGHIGSQPLTPA